MKAVCLAAAMCLLAFPAAWAERREKIGVSLPLTGEGAIYGNDIRNVLEFANREIAGSRYKLVCM